MVGKGEPIITNDTKISLLSDLKVECRSTEDCSGYLQSVCSSQQCNCTTKYPVFIESEKSCLKAAFVNVSCSFTEQCNHTDIYSECSQSRKVCVCIKSFYLKEFPEIGYSCVTKSQKHGSNGVDPAMVGVLVGLVLMFVIICVVLRLFSKARFRENRSIFNTPNPRLMNASLFKDKRRGSAISNVSATGSASGTTVHARSMSITGGDKGHHKTTVAIEAVD